MKQGLVSEPLAYETIQRRQRGNGHGAHEEIEGRLRHSFGQTAHGLHVAGARSVQHRARSEEKQPFERGMVDGVIEAGN